jgi:murein L,D-transpeptidase YcbB/YkuD
VINSLARTLCAALLVSAVPGAAFAEASTRMAGPAAADNVSYRVQPRLPSTLEIPSSGRFVLVDAASAQLFMIEDGRVQDTMRVIVGKPDAATPVVKSAIYDATLNPYWHVPADLARTIIAPRVLKDGASYLKERGYQVLSSFDEDAREIPVSSVDWKAVAEGKARVFVRQLPGPTNSMGRMKFAFANEGGIYLHDTPRKELFDDPERKLSAGCVRLEDAERLASWLLGTDPEASNSTPEQKVALPRPVPITITYLDQPARIQLAGL